MASKHISIKNFVFAGLEKTDFLIKKPAVELITDDVHLAVLLGAQKAARASYLKVTHGDPDT